MSNTYLTDSIITREALMVLENNLVAAKKINREYDDRFARDGAKVGSVINVRKPPKYQGRVGAAMVVEDATETQVPVAVNKQFGVDLEFADSDLALNIDDFSKRFLRPAVSRIANEIDADVLLLYKQVYQAVGTPGTVPNALLTYLLAGVALDNAAAPSDGQRSIVINPLMQATMVDALKGLFQQSSAIAAQYAKGQMGTAGGFDWNMDQNVATHTVGPLGGTPLVNGANQTGTSLITDGWTAAAASRLLQGDVFTIANVFMVNPMSGVSNGQLQQFTVMSDVSSDGSGNLTAIISPAIITAGPFKTVNAVPADNAALTILGAANTASPVGLAFHPDFATLVCVDLPLVKGVDMCGRMQDKQLGLSIRLIRDYEIRNDQRPCRLDVLYGVSILRPELACRIHS